MSQWSRLKRTFRHDTHVDEIREELDAEAGLRQNIDGLRVLLQSQRDHAALKSFDD